MSQSQSLLQPLAIATHPFVSLVFTFFKNHVSNILSRLGLRDRTQAAIYARERHLLS